MIVVYLRNVGTEEDQCWVVCAKGDPGAVEFEGFPDPFTPAYPQAPEKTGDGA